MSKKIYYYYQVEDFKDIEIFSDPRTSEYNFNPRIFGPFNTYLEAKKDAIDQVRSLLDQVRSLTKYPRKKGIYG